MTRESLSDLLTGPLALCCALAVFLAAALDLDGERDSAASLATATHAAR